MLVPLNNKERQDLCLSIIRKKEGYSVAIVSIINGYGMNSLPSYACNLHDEENLVDACTCIEDYEIISGQDLYDCIEQCLAQLD